MWILQLLERAPSSKERMARATGRLQHQGRGHRDQRLRKTELVGKPVRPGGIYQTNSSLVTLQVLGTSVRD